MKLNQMRNLKRLTFFERSLRLLALVQDLSTSTLRIRLVFKLYTHIKINPGSSQPPVTPMDLEYKEKVMLNTYKDLIM